MGPGKFFQIASVCAFIWTLGIGVGIYYEAEVQSGIIPTKTSLKTLTRKTGTKAGLAGPLSTIEAQKELRIVRACSGEIVEDPEFNISFGRVTVFFKTQLSSPKIITAVVENLSSPFSSDNRINSYHFSDLNRLSVEENGVVAEHGSLTELAFMDAENAEARLTNLIDEAADLCLGGSMSERQFLSDSDRFRDEIRREASAYLTMDLQIPRTDAKITVYYELNGEIRKSDFLINLYHG